MEQNKYLALTNDSDGRQTAAKVMVLASATLLVPGCASLTEQKKGDLHSISHRGGVRGAQIDALKLPDRVVVHEVWERPKAEESAQSADGTAKMPDKVAVEYTRPACPDCEEDGKKPSKRKVTSYPTGTPLDPKTHEPIGDIKVQVSQQPSDKASTAGPVDEDGLVLIRKEVVIEKGNYAVFSEESTLKQIGSAAANVGLGAGAVMTGYGAILTGQGAKDYGKAAQEGKLADHTEINNVNDNTNINKNENTNINKLKNQNNDCDTIDIDIRNKNGVGHHRKGVAPRLGNGAF